MKKHFAPKGHTMSGVFVFLLIGVFAVASVILVLTGVKVYRSVTDSAAANADYQLAISYLRNKVHTYDHQNGISIREMDGLQALSLAEIYDGEKYETYIYFYEGALYELFIDAGTDFDPELGERLTEVQAISFSTQTPGLLQVDVTLPSGREHTVHMALRSAQAR